MPYPTFYQAAETILNYPSVLLTQACSFIASGAGKLREALLALKTGCFTGNTAIFHTLPSAAARLPPPLSLLDIPSDALHLVAEQLGREDKLKFQSACATLRNFYPAEQTTWLPFQIAHDRLFDELESPRTPFNHTLAKRCYRETLLHLLDPATTDLERTAAFTEQLQKCLSYADIAEVLDHVLQQSIRNISKQWEKLASVNLHLCVTLSGIATMEKLAEYGVDRHFFSGYFPTDNARIEAFLNRIKNTRSHHALDCAMWWKEIAVKLLTHPTTPGFLIANILVSAVCDHDTATVNLFVDNKVNLNFQDRKGWTALTMACQFRYTALVKLLLEHGADVNLREDENGSTALIIASRNTNTAIAQLLLDHGAKVNLQDKFGLTALIMASSLEGASDVVQRLLDYKADTELQNEEGHTAFTAACRENIVDTARLLLDRGANINAEVNNGLTALMIAYKYQLTDMAQLLLDYGASVNRQNKHGATALMTAAQWAPLEQVQQLLNNGANTELQSKWGWTPLMLACRRGERTIAQLLLDHGANLEHQDEEGLTALAHACGTRNKELVTLLLQRGAQITPQTLSVAEEKGNDDILQLLRNAQQQALQTA